MNRDDVTWRGYWPASPTPFRADESYDAERTATCSSGTSARDFTAS